MAYPGQRFTLSSMVLAIATPSNLEADELWVAFLLDPVSSESMEKINIESI